MAYDNTNRGTIAKNTRKTEDKHPDIAGSIVVECPCCGEKSDLWLNGWQKKNGKDGSTFYSLTVKPKEARQEPTPRQAHRDRDDPRTDYDADLPF